MTTRETGGSLSEGAPSKHTETSRSKMEELFESERVADAKVHALLKNKDEPILNILGAVGDYRQLARAAMFVDFESGAERRSWRIWAAHTEARKLLQQALLTTRKKQEPVTARQITKLYLQFLKDSQSFYREYIYDLHTTFGGISELEMAAHQVKGDSTGESLPSTVPLELRRKVLEQCHQSLIYLGDISRYRASDKLDKNPDFGPAIGFYGLACVLFPSSGMGHHQQAVVALEQRHHLRAIHHLYRAIVAEEPHPNAKDNLRLEFDKTNAAWDRGELIQKGQPNDPEGPKKTLVGWFIRLHSMCIKGEPFRGYEELEREVLGQLTSEIKQRPLDSTLVRMLSINFSAQYEAGEKFQANPIEQHQRAFYHFFRFNIRTLATLLQLFHDEVRRTDLDLHNDDDVDLALRLLPITRRVLPALRLCSSWLLAVVHLLAGLAEDEFLKDAIDQLWTSYAKAVDAVAAVFPIWDLEDLPVISYLLEEDVETVGFKPLVDEKTRKVWYDRQTGVLKPRFYDRGVAQAPEELEMLVRIKDFLADGLYLANDDEQAPIKLQGTRILHRDAVNVEPMPMLITRKEIPLPNKMSESTEMPAPSPKPLSYAAAVAANGPAEKASQSNMIKQTSGRSRQAELSRMVDDLVDDSDETSRGHAGNMPVTPPQHPAMNPVVVTKGDVSYSSLYGGAQDFARIPNNPHQPKPKQNNGTTDMQSSSPGLKTPNSSVLPYPLTSRPVSSIWGDNGAHNTSVSPNFPSGLPTGTLQSPIYGHSRGHSRVNSASSIRSRASQTATGLGNVGESWSSLDGPPLKTTTPLPGLGPSLPESVFPSSSGFNALESTNVSRPLLFGAGGGPWSTNTARATSGHNFSSYGQDG